MKAWKDFKCNTRLVGYSSTPSHALKIKDQLSALEEMSDAILEKCPQTTNTQKDNPKSLESPDNKKVVIMAKTPSTASTSASSFGSADSTVVDQSIFSSTSSASMKSNANISPSFTPYTKDSGTSSSRHFMKSLFTSPSPIANKQYENAASSSSTNRSRSRYSWKEALHARKIMSGKQIKSRLATLSPSSSLSPSTEGIPAAEASSALKYECIREHLESFKKSALEGLMETVSLDDSFHEFESVDDHDEDCSDENSEEIDELRTENLGLKERIERYEAELMQLVERCNKCPQCSISL